MENWLMKTSLEWLEQAEHGGDNERCKMIAGMLRVLWRNAPPAAATQGEAADALSRQQPSKEAIEVATKYMDNGPYGAWAVMASEILRLAGEGKP